MKKIFLLALAFAAPILAYADGTTDFLIEPGATFTIAAPGSYRLAADVNMTLPIAAISIGANNVTLDLNGHTITGAAGGNGPGISAAAATNITVINGTITGFGGYGITLQSASTVRNCRIIGNNREGASGGILVTGNSIVDQCIVTGNSAISGGSTFAISVGETCRVSGNIVESNNSSTEFAIGISTAANCCITDNMVRNNNSTTNGVGINAGLSCIIRGNTVSNNDNLALGSATGISANAGCLIEANVCSDHTTPGSGTAVGIIGTSCTIINNDCANNVGGGGGSGRGILVNTGSMVRGNRCEGNASSGTGFGAGIVVTTSCSVEDNLCRANAGLAGSWGIRVTGTSNLIANNKLQLNGIAMFFSNALNNRAVGNQMRESDDFDPAGVTPASVGAGDLANVLY